MGVRLSPLKSQADYLAQATATPRDTSIHEEVASNGTTHERKKALNLILKNQSDGFHTSKRSIHSN